MAHADLEQRVQRRVGTVLRGKYALERVLGTGGMGAVYLGVHRNGHRVAVKVLHPEASADVRARFLREGYVANSIGHPGAVRVLDDDEAEERITGPALARALPRLLPPGEPIDVGPGGIFQAFSLLGSGKGIDLVGTTTTLDFDLATGDAPADFAVFCYAPGRDGGPPASVESGLVYRARLRRFEGALRCP
jgi:serine/threonine protein kinase